MKMTVRQPLFGIGGVSKSLPTFGQARSERYQHRLDRAVSDRRKMLALEHAGEKPLDDVGQARGAQLERQIDRLQQSDRLQKADSDQDS